VSNIFLFVEYVFLIFTFVQCFFLNKYLRKENNLYFSFLFKLKQKRLDLLFIKKIHMPKMGLEGNNCFKEQNSVIIIKQ
jgi:hypothetical protein